MSERTRSIAGYAGSLLLPVLLAILGHEFAYYIVPGSIKVMDWKVASALACLVAIIPMLFVLVRSKFQWFAKLGLALLGAVVLFISSFTLGATTRCGDEPVYIGKMSDMNQVASCG